MIRSSRTAITLGLLSAAIAGIAVGQNNEGVFDNSGWCDDGRETWTRNGETWHRACEVRTLSFEPQGNAVRVDASLNGGISVRAGADEGITVHARIVAASREEGAAQDLLQEISVERIDGVFVSNGPELEGDEAWWSVSFRVEAPKYSDLDLKSFNGGITIDGIEGELKASTMNGGIEVRDCAGSIIASTVNGGVSAIDVVGAVAAESTNGGVSVALSEAPTEPVLARSTNGSVSLKLPAGTQGAFSVSTRIGNLSVDAPGNRHSETGGEVSFEIGEGGPSIEAATEHGQVSVQVAGQ